MSESLHLHDACFHVYEHPKKYDSLKDTYIINWQDSQNFLPKNYLKSFDSILFYNFIHRECFRSSIKNTSNIDQSEISLYRNCVSKHNYSIGVFSNILQSSRKWNGFLSYIDIREYSRHPEELGTTIPTNPIIRKQYLDMQKMKENKERGNSIQNLLGQSEDPNPFNFVYEHLIQKNESATKSELEEN